MAWALLCALILLLSRGDPSVSPEGEWCRGWTDDRESPVAAFQCLQSQDGEDALFCCGTCSLPYCCSSGEARLDQRQCPRAGRQQVSTTTKGPPPEGSTTGWPRTSRPATTMSHPQWRLPHGFILFFFLTVATALWVTACYFKQKYCHRPDENFSNPDRNMGLIRLRTLRRQSLLRSPSSTIGDPTCSVAYDPPRYGAVDSGGNRDLPPLSPPVHIQSSTTRSLKKEYKDCSPVRRNIPGRALEPIMEVESSADL